jgi:hypothetical protein
MALRNHTRIAMTYNGYLSDHVDAGGQAGG